MVREAYRTRVYFYFKKGVIIMDCQEKHTKYQPTDKEFNCPKCHAKSGIFHVEAEVDKIDCEFIHPTDLIICDDCGYETTGQAFVKKLIEKNNLVPCAYCKGKGLVKR
jgi:transcription elongation factor Elf1